METLDQRLDAVASRMGGFLRGFRDPRVHLGSAARFNVEFRRIMSLRALNAPGAKHPISYSEAAESFRAPAAAAASSGPADPVTTMVQGLGQAADGHASLRRELPLGTLRQDLSALLRVPALFFYVSISDREAFFTRLAGIAASEGFPLIAGEGSGARCRSCGSVLLAAQPGRPLKCSTCGQAHESVRALPMVSGVTALVSFELLRRIVALDLVESYQEEGKIVPLGHGSETP